MAPFSRLSAVLLAAGVACVAQAVTPMEKVVSLLEDLKKDVLDEGKTEAKAYEKFSCFCKDKTKSKSESVEKSQDKIDSTSADIEDKIAKKKDKITKLGEEQVKVEETTADLKSATETYEKDKAEYEATNADLTKALGSLDRAKKALTESKGAAFLEVGRSPELQQTLAVADALGLLPSNKQQAMTAFLQGASSDPGDYKFHSDKIIEIITSLKKDFGDKKKEVESEWQKTDSAYKKVKKDLEEVIKTAKDEIKALSEDIDDLKEAIAKKKKELAQAESTLKDDSLYLHDLTTKCEEKAQSWDQRTSQRNDEVNALTKALEIMTDTVKDLDSEVNKRALLLQPKKPVAAKPAQPPAKKEAAPANASKAPVEKKAAASKTASFLQVSRSSSKVQRASAVLSRAGARLGSTMLSSLSKQMTSDPFDKIKKLIQGLIQRLLEESKAEATKKGFCDTEMGKAEHQRDNKYAEIVKLDAAIEQLEASEVKLGSDIDTLGGEVKELTKTLKEATELRKTEKETNEKTIEKAKEGAKAVGEALVILQDFYKKAAKASLLQRSSASPIEEDDPGSGFDGSYKGSQDSSKAILGLLETIKTDFERTDRQTEAEEKTALEKFVEFERSSKADIAAKSMKKKLNEQDLESTKTALKTSMVDLQDATDLLDASLKTLEDLKPTCMDTGMSYKERVKKREEEMKALETALCILDTEGVESKC